MDKVEIKMVPLKADNVWILVPDVMVLPVVYSLINRINSDGSVKAWDLMRDTSESYELKEADVSPEDYISGLEGMSLFYIQIGDRITPLGQKSSLLVTDVSVNYSLRTHRDVIKVRTADGGFELDEITFSETEEVWVG